MASLLHRIVYDESDWLNMRNTKAYKNYLLCHDDGEDSDKAEYLGWVAEQIRERKLDNRHLIASGKCADTHKIGSVYAEEALTNEIEALLESHRVAAERARVEHDESAVDATPTEPMIESVLDTAPAEPSLRSVLDTAPTEPSLESVLDTAPAEPSLRSVLDTAPTEPSLESVLDTAPAEPSLESVMSAALTATAPTSDPDIYKLRFIHSADWRGVDVQTRQVLDSNQSNRSDGQLLVLHKLANLGETHSALFDYLFITSLATDATKKDPLYAHVADNGSVIFSAANANGKTLPVFRIQHGDVVSDTCINTATCAQNEKTLVYQCTFPSSHTSTPERVVRHQ